MKIPNSRRNLDLAIERKFGHGNSYMRARTAMANVVVGQLLPGGAVKGGSAIRLRFGEEVTRFTTDLDVARATGLDEYVADLEDALDEGWCGFSGTVVPRRPAHPKDVPDQYVMRPYDIKLSYNGMPWCTVPLEVAQGPGWEKRYDDQRAGVDVLPTVTEAVEWANDFVRRIARA